MGLVADVEHARAVEPDDLEQLFVKGLNAGDVEAVMTLFERDAVVALSDRGLCMGIEAIRAALDDLVASGVKLTLGEQQPTLRVGDLALTSTRLSDGAVTAEVARRQPDGTWRWVIDSWNILGG